MLIEFKSIVSRNPSPCRLFIFTGRENVTSKAVANSTVHRWTSHRCNEPPLRFESHTDQIKMYEQLDAIFIYSHIILNS